MPQVTRLLRKERVPEAALCPTAREVVAGRLRAGEANLGGGLLKKRFARPGGSKRGGFRAIVADCPPRSERVVFAFCFAKNVPSTLTPDRHEALATVGSAFVATTNEQLGGLLAVEDVRAIVCDGD